MTESATGGPGSGTAAGIDQHPPTRVGSHTAAYLLARGVPGLVAFLAIPVFTELLEPEEYARYAIAVAALNVANSLIFQWIRLSMVRFFPAPHRLGAYTSTVVTLWAVLTALAGVATGLALALPWTSAMESALVLGWLVLAAQSLFDIVAEYSRAALRPWHYMGMQMVRAAALVGLGFVLLRAGVGWTAPLIAVGTGMTLAIISAWRRDWRQARFRIHRGTARDMATYGLPVSLTVALVGVVFLVDRGLVAALLGGDPAGVYSVAFDFTAQTVTLVMVAVSMATYPIAVRAFEAGGSAAARDPMTTNAVLLVGAGLPVATGAAVLAPGIASSFFGPGYLEAARVIPLVALAAVIAGLKAYHFDAALQLARRTGHQLWIALATVCLSVPLTIAFLHLFGLPGAALANVLTFAFALAVTAWLGRRYCPLPFPRTASLQAFVASAVMAVALLPFRDVTGGRALTIQVVAGALLYCSSLLLLDWHGTRRRVVALLGSRGRDSSPGPVPPASTVVCMYAPFASGGHPRYVAELMRATAAKVLAEEGGPSVELVSSIDLAQSFRSDDYTVHPVLPALRERSSFRSTGGWALSRLSHYFRRDIAFLSWLRTRPDVGAVHFQELSPGIGHRTVRAVRRRGMAVLITVHNVRPHSYPRLVPRQLVDRAARRAYLDSDVLFVHGPELAQELAEFLRGEGVGGKAAPVIRVVEHGVWSVAQAEPPTEKRLRERLAQKRLLFFGAIRRNKGLHVLLEAAAEGRLSGYSITVAGEPLEEDYFRTDVLPLVDAARRAGTEVDLRASFVADQELGPLFDAHSALVLPYTHDFRAQSGAAFLALAHGLPIVATAAGGLQQLLTSGDVGARIMAADAPSVAEALRHLFEEDGKSPADIAAGIRSVLDSMSWDGMARATLAEYRRLLVDLAPATTSDAATS